MIAPRLIKRSHLMAYNGVGFFKIPGQVAALRPIIIQNARAASTTSGLWLPKLTEVS